MSHEFDLNQTLLINLEMINNFSSMTLEADDSKDKENEVNRNFKADSFNTKKDFLAISQLLVNIKEKLTCKQNLKNLKVEEKRKMLILKQIKASSVRNNEEAISKFSKQIITYNDLVSEKNEAIVFLNKRLMEFEVYIQRMASKENNENTDLTYLKEFRILDFSEMNFDFALKRKGLYQDLKELQKVNLELVKKRKDKLTESIIRVLNKESSNSSLNVSLKISSNSSFNIHDHIEGKPKNKSSKKQKSVKKTNNGYYSNTSKEGKKKKTLGLFGKKKKEEAKKAEFSEYSDCGGINNNGNKLPRKYTHEFDKDQYGMNNIDDNQLCESPINTNEINEKQTYSAENIDKSKIIAKGKKQGMQKNVKRGFLSKIFMRKQANNQRPNQPIPPTSGVKRFFKKKSKQQGLNTTLNKKKYEESKVVYEMSTGINTIFKEKEDTLIIKMKKTSFNKDYKADNFSASDIKIYDNACITNYDTKSNIPANSPRNLNSLQENNPIESYTSNNEITIINESKEEADCSVSFSHRKEK